MKRDVSEVMPRGAVDEVEDMFPDIPTIGMKCTDLGNAERLVARYRDRIRYCPPRRGWYIDDGKRWRFDETGEICRMAKKTVRAIHSEAEHATSEDMAKRISKHAIESEKKARIDAMVALAATETGIPVMPGELDADPWLLNCNNGTVDLRTGKLRPHRAVDYITKIVPIDYDPNATNELWYRFLHDATGGDAGLLRFLQRFAGYSATGLTSEKRFFFVYSKHHDTGKSTIADALRSALGEYAMDADFETWLEQTHTGGNRGDVARLTGARLVISVEVRRRAKFDTKLMKAITGGDPITCAAKYEKEFTYKPQFKIMLVANDPPAIREDDRPMFERCLRIPFDVVVPKEKRDPEVKRRLSDPNDAGPAILRWIVDGAVAWHKEKGLGIPHAVRESSDAYVAEMDRFAGFLRESCIREPRATATKKDFREAYEWWCRDNGIRAPMSIRDVAQRLSDLDVGTGSTGSVRFWKGIRLRRTDEPYAPDTTDTNAQNFSHETSKGIVTEIGVSGVSAVNDDEERDAIRDEGGCE